MSEVAIVIPCYKGTFLKETLDSLVRQSEKDFRVYIGDDNSPDDIESIVRPYFGSLQLVYKKFNDNLGSRSLVRQWIRCIELTDNEPWIWLLPDDDYAEPCCIEGFLETKRNHESDLYRFNTDVVDENGRELESNEDNPSHETGAAFIAGKLAGIRRSSLAEYIFSRKAYEQYGITEFPMAWCSDDATWMNYSKGKHIITIIKGRVHVRISSESISGKADKFGPAKIEACLEFLTFLKKNYSDALQAEFRKMNTSFDEVTKKWFLIQLSNCKMRLSRFQLMQYYFRHFSRIWGWFSKATLKLCYFLLMR